MLVTVSVTHSDCWREKSDRTHAQCAGNTNPSQLEEGGARGLRVPLDEVSCGVGTCVEWRGGGCRVQSRH